MKNAFHYSEASEASGTGFGAACFDLDGVLTDTDRPIHGMTPEEIAALPLNAAVVAKMEQAKAMGIPVVMVTRNDRYWIDQFLAAHSEIAHLFTDTLPCPTGNKSDAIKVWIEAHEIPEEQVFFVDDTLYERNDVERNVEGSQVVDPGEIHSLTLRRAKRTRSRTRRLLNRSGQALESNEVLLAA